MKGKPPISDQHLEGWTHVVGKTPTHNPGMILYGDLHSVLKAELKQKHRDQSHQISSDHGRIRFIPHKPVGLALVVARSWKGE